LNFLSNIHLRTLKDIYFLFFTSKTVIREVEIARVLLVRLLKTDFNHFFVFFVIDRAINMSPFVDYTRHVRFCVLMNYFDCETLRYSNKINVKTMIT